MKTLQEQLVEKGFSQAHTGEVVKESTKTRGKPMEELTDRDWAELMGTNRQTYKRVNGAVRRR